MLEPITPDNLKTMDQQRRRDYLSLLSFYAGNQWERQPQKRERQLTVNYAKALIDKTASYMMTDLTFAVEPTRETGRQQERALRAEDALTHVYEDNQLAMLDFDTEIDTAILGDGAYKVTWDVAEQRVRVGAPDVQNLYVWTAPDDLNEVLRVASQHTTPQKVTITELWTPQWFELWHDNDRTVSEPNPYGFIPFIIFPNLRRPKQFWGESDIPAIRQSQRELNRSISNLSMIMELSGNPITVLENVDAADNVEIHPGAVWELPEKARAYLLDLLAGGGVRLHIDYIDLLYRTLHDLGEAPRTAFGDNARNLSGVALEVELQPLLHKVARKRLIRSAAYTRRNSMILQLLTKFTGQDYAPFRSRIVWGAVTPKDRTAAINDERKLIASAIHSHRRAMDNLGIEDPDAELARWLDEERQIAANLAPPPAPTTAPAIAPTSDANAKPDTQPKPEAKAITPPPVSGNLA